MPVLFRPALVAAITMTAALSAPMAVRAQTLKVGDPAPALTVSKWVKGAEVSSFEKGKMYVVEFWATWCGPCKVSIPHLTEMQKANPDVQFIGVSVFEDDQKLVAPFVEKMGDKMAYAVAMDNVPEGAKRNEGAMAKNWMIAAEQDGIPTAFIVDRDGKIAWIGHPVVDGMDKVIEKMKAGTFDGKTAATERETAEAAQKAMRQTMMSIAAAAKRSPKEGIAEIDKAMATATDPDMKLRLSSMRYGLLLSDDEKAAYAYAKKMGDSDWKGSPELLNAVSYGIADNGGKLKTPDYALALSLAEKAAAGTQYKNAAILDTLAYAQYKKGDKKKAAETQKKALALLKANNTPAEQMKDYEDHLALFTK